METVEIIKKQINEIHDGILEKHVKPLQERLEAIENNGLSNEENQKALDQVIIDIKELKGGSYQVAKPVTLGQAFENALNHGDNFKNLEMLAKNHKEKLKRFVIEIKSPGDMSTSNVTGSRYGQVMSPNIIEPNKRRVHVRTLVSIGQAGPGNTYTYMREKSTGEGEPTPVSEGSEKQQMDLDLEEATVNFETIAGWLRLTRKAMNNIPGLISYLNSRLPEKLMRAEDKQLLVGDGSTPNISGIMDSGNYTAADTDATVLAEALIDSIAQLEDDEERNATGILLRPRAYYSFFKNKADGDTGVYDLPKNFSFEKGTLYISGVPVYASTAMSRDANGSQMNKYIVGDFEMGAQLLIQEAMRLEFFEQDGTNVRENKVTVRVEETVAFPVFGDNYFIVGDDPDAS